MVMKSAKRGEVRMGVDPVPGTGSVLEGEMERQN